jgi:hypothetical protein
MSAILTEVFHAFLKFSGKYQGVIKKGQDLHTHKNNPSPKITEAFSLNCPFPLGSTPRHPSNQSFSKGSCLMGSPFRNGTVTYSYNKALTGNESLYKISAGTLNTRKSGECLYWGTLLLPNRSRCNSGSIVSYFGLDDREIGVRSSQGQSIFPLTSVSRPALGPTQPPVQWEPGVLSPGQSAAGAWRWPLTPI